MDVKKQYDCEIISEFVIFIAIGMKSWTYGIDYGVVYAVILDLIGGCSGEKCSFEGWLKMKFIVGNWAKDPEASESQIWVQEGFRVLFCINNSI